MITKINKIKNLGLVLSDYTWGSHIKTGIQLPEFKRYNLIYGWNATGKTTLSKLFDAVENGELKSTPSLEYEIEDKDKHKFKNGEKFNQKVRVFNQDYIENNIKIREGKAKSITLVLGDVNKDIVEQIEEDKNRLSVKSDELKKQTSLMNQKNKNKGSVFTEIAKTIYIAIIGGAVRNYIKTNAEADFSILTKKELLIDDELQKNAIAVKQNSEPKLDIIEEIKFKYKEEDKNLDLAITDLLNEAKILLGQTVESQIIERLKDHPDISSWVETGIKIHEEHKSTNCEFCGETIRKVRLLELSKHFNEADKKLKDNIDVLIDKLNKIKVSLNNIQFHDKARLYAELQNTYETNVKNLNTEKEIIIKTLSKIIKLLEDKKYKTTDTLELKEELKTDKFIKYNKDINSLIENHNKKTDEFDTQKNKTIDQLKTHYLSTIYDDVKNLEKEIIELGNKIDKIKNGDSSVPGDLGIDGLNKRISENQAKISSTHKACEEINKGLSTFLGRTELIFETNKTKITDDKGQQKEIEDGYVIKRNGDIARNLSESEKTAIAFVYFTIHLKDQDFDLSKGIVIVDDPVSSLDSNCLFQAFAFLKNAVKDAEQVFVFTHNFELLKLLLNWQKNNDRGNQCSFYMIKNCCETNGRCAFLDNMDKELQKYESEYHYLFKKLYEFQSDGTIGQSYPIPNIARKVLDTFLLFRIPSGENNIYKKLMKLQSSTGFDENKVTAIYKFVNDQSHITGSGFDPALVPETQKTVKYLLEMMKEVFREHYDILENSIR
jgi:wobble nucleotide-excising tRNase